MVGVVVALMLDFHEASCSSLAEQRLDHRSIPGKSSPSTHLILEFHSRQMIYLSI